MLIIANYNAEVVERQVSSVSIISNLIV